MLARNNASASPQADLINQLYQGKLKDYVRCLECGYESWRIDTYLDIPLVIRPFGASQAYGSVVGFSCQYSRYFCYLKLILIQVVAFSFLNFNLNLVNVILMLLQEEALQAFIQPETLDGPNQYFCERCKKKCDARKVSKVKT